MCSAEYFTRDIRAALLRSGRPCFVVRTCSFHWANYGERYRNGERISTGFVESAINQVVSKRMVKKQQMQWTQRGAHLLLQVRTRVLNEEWEDVFRRWYPDFRQQQSMKVVA
jgi:hypothetical protein